MNHMDEKLTIHVFVVVVVVNVVVAVVVVLFFWSLETISMNAKYFSPSRALLLLLLLLLILMTQSYKCTRIGYYFECKNLTNHDPFSKMCHVTLNFQITTILNAQYLPRYLVWSLLIHLDLIQMSIYVCIKFSFYDSISTFSWLKINPLGMCHLHFFIHLFFWIEWTAHVYTILDSCVFFFFSLSAVTLNFKTQIWWKCAIVIFARKLNCCTKSKLPCISIDSLSIYFLLFFFVSKDRLSL